MMKIKIILVLVILYSISNLSAVENNTYEEKLVHTFNVGYGLKDIGVIQEVDVNEGDPTSFNINDKGDFIISDRVNSRILIFNSKYELVNTYDVGPTLSFFRNLVEKQDIIVGESGNWHFFVYNKLNNLFKKISFSNVIRSSSVKAVITDIIIFNYYIDGSICSYVLEDLETMKLSNLLNEEETLSLFENPRNYGLEGYTIDDQKRIFLDGVIQNTDHKTLYKYWTELHEKYDMKVPREVPGIPPFEKLNGTGAPFRGYDNDRNCYRSGESDIIIYDSNGWVLDYFIFKHQRFLGPSINSMGDIFYTSLRYDNGNNYIDLYKIQRQW